MAEQDERMIGQRRQANATGQCPVCGATMRGANRAERREMERRYGKLAGLLPTMTMEHEPNCSVGDGPLERWAS